jgi:hypothetical protein
MAATLDCMQDINDAEVCMACARPQPQPARTSQPTRPGRLCLCGKPYNHQLNVRPPGVRSHMPSEIPQPRSGPLRRLPVSSNPDSTTSPGLLLLWMRAPSNTNLDVPGLPPARLRSGMLRREPPRHSSVWALCEATPTSVWLTRPHLGPSGALLLWMRPPGQTIPGLRGM